MNNIHGELHLTSRLAYAMLIVIVVGLACVVYGEIRLANVDLTFLEQSDYFVWNWSFNLTRGKTYRIDILADNRWGKVYAQAGFTYAQPVNVTITSPSGTVTSLQAFFYSVPPENPYYKEGTPPTTVDIKYQNVDETDFRVIMPSTKININIRQGGNYTFQVWKETVWTDTPPNYFGLIEEYVPDSASYSLMVFIGGIATTSGGVVYVANTFKKGRLRQKKVGK
jgi:hypothetical protein